MKCARRAGVASPFLKERGRGRLGPRQVAWGQLREVAFAGSKTLPLVLSPPAKGEATDHPRFAVLCGHCKDGQPEISNAKIANHKK